MKIRLDFLVFIFALAVIYTAIYFSSKEFSIALVLGYAFGILYMIALDIACKISSDIGD